jgi:hypothetical protein
MNEEVEKSNKILVKFSGKKTRPIDFGELCIILSRFQIMIQEEPDRYTIGEFIEQEDYRRDLFKK